MDRLTFEGDFCDIAMCGEVRGGSFCEDGACSQRKVWERLKHYEDLEEQGRLVELPCKVGDILYITEPRYYNGQMHKGVQRGEVYGFELDEERLVWARLDDDTPHSGNAYPFADFGKTVFLTRPEAEAALKEAHT